ncbi:hypothetical protein PG993_007070 [Apiospora rasikravindrae]|uniref:Uncharacterized protein n=1 Tax=Apiospora rasikravindrae TaxID=990691 RepID=A0ABR1SY89_9PEZI
MARVTTILTLSLVAVTALATGNGDLISGGSSVEENELGLEGQRQSAPRNMLDVDILVGRSPYQLQQQEQIDGTSTTNIPASITPAPTAILNSRQLPGPPNPGGGRGGAQPLPDPDGGRGGFIGAGLAVGAVIFRRRQSLVGGVSVGKCSGRRASVQPDSEYQRESRRQPLERHCFFDGHRYARPAGSDLGDGDTDGYLDGRAGPAATGVGVGNGDGYNNTNG